MFPSAIPRERATPKVTHHRRVERGVGRRAGGPRRGGRRRRGAAAALGSLVQLLIERLQDLQELLPRLALEKVPP
eukprot:1608337-Pyramimonas_sp.AAC.1